MFLEYEFDDIFWHIHNPHLVGQMIVKVEHQITCVPCYYFVSFNFDCHIDHHCEESPKSGKHETTYRLPEVASHANL
jgi:hypothetical protein